MAVQAAANDDGKFAADTIRFCVKSNNAERQLVAVTEADQGNFAIVIDLRQTDQQRPAEIAQRTVEPGANVFR